MNRVSHWTFTGIAAMCLATIAGCTDLMVEPKSTVTVANVFKDPSSYQAFLAKLYAGLAVSGQQGAAGQPDIAGIDEGFSQYLRLYWEHEELPTDEAIIGWGDLGLPEMNTQQWAVGNNFVGAMYYRVFYQIVLANEFLRQTTDAKLDSRGHTSATLKAQVKQYRAEARFLRALSYWHGIDLFGDIPLLTEANPLGTLPQQRPRAEIYDFLVNELTAIKADLPPNGPASYGRATPAAADMLLAQLYLNAAVYSGTPHYTEALTAAQAVISSGSFSLDPSYAHLFQADNNTSPEIIFPVTSDGKSTETWGGMTFLVHASCGGSMPDSSLMGVKGCWWGLRLRPEAYNRYTAGDRRANLFYRAGQNVAVTAVGTFTVGIAAPKFRNWTSTGQLGKDLTFPDTDFPMFRLADAYLIYAEASLRGGGGSPSQALDYVNALRVRAYGDSTGVISGPLTLDVVLDERSRELLWEGHRRTDLVRYGRFTGSSYLWAWKGGVVGGTGTASYLNLYPIPANELIANPNLKQNAGY